MFILNCDISYITAFFVGFFGSIHCLGMCGSIVIILSINLPKNKNIYLYHLCYNAGRMISYFIIGFVAGLLGFLISGFFGSNVFFVFKVIGGFSLLSIGLYLSGLFYFRNFFEKIGWMIWLCFYPYIKKIIPIKYFWQAVLIGIIWGNIPCGLVYSVLIWSISFGSFFKSANLMILFGFGTLPSMLIVGFFTLSLKKIVNNKYIRFLISFSIFLFGLLTIIITILEKNCH